MVIFSALLLGLVVVNTGSAVAQCFVELTPTPFSAAFYCENVNKAKVKLVVSHTDQDILVQCIDSGIYTAAVKVLLLGADCTLTPGVQGYTYKLSFKGQQLEGKFDTPPISNDVSVPSPTNSPFTYPDDATDQINSGGAACDIVEDFGGTCILGRPTDTSITFSMSFHGMGASDAKIIVYDEEMSYFSTVYPDPSYTYDDVDEIHAGGLHPDSIYFYQIIYNKQDGGPSTAVCSPLYHFHTPRAQGQSFSFAITSDSHLGTDKHCDPDRWVQTLENIHGCLDGDGPDFMIDLGDTARVSKIGAQQLTTDNINACFNDQRPYFTVPGRKTAVFYVPGNHELQLGALKDGTSLNTAIISKNAMIKYFVNPFPGVHGETFYEGNSQAEEFITGNGLLHNFFAWRWGDCLFICLDDFWYTMTTDSTPSWETTLGNAQYNWLEDVLSKWGKLATTESPAKRIFVFHHHILGRTRGGLDVASLYEWGGQEKGGDSKFAFEEARPGWRLPVRDLLAFHGVDIMFQGHDHLFAKETVRSEYGEVVYVTVPMACAHPDTWEGGPNDNSKHFYPDIEFGTEEMLAGPSGHLSVEYLAENDEVEVLYYGSRILGDTGSNCNVIKKFSII